MDENYIEMMRQNLKAAGMPDAQIDAMIQMQQSAMSMGAEQMTAMANNLSEMGINMDDADMEDFVMVENPSVNTSYQWAIACGADLAQLRGDILNDLNTDKDTEMSGSVLSNDWGIENHEDAVSMCDSLVAGRHSKRYNADAEKTDGEHSEEIAEALEVFTADNLLPAGSRAPNMLIWDLGRLVTVARLAFDAGWLNRDEVMHYLRELAPLVQSVYKSWRDVSIAYQFGRAVWGGIDEFQYAVMKSNMEDLLNADGSPWKNLPFDMKLEF